LGADLYGSRRDQERLKAKGEVISKITAFLWFDDKAEEAMNFYVAIFKNSKADSVTL
jgi:hypothetical protein